MTILGIETSSPLGSLALRRDDRCLEERFLPALARRGTRILVPEIMAFLRRHDLRPADLDAVAVSIGPGGFTGLRVGLTCAKTLAWANGASLVAVDTFQAVAENVPSEESVAVIVDGQRRGVLLGIMSRTRGGGWERLGPFEMVRREELRDRISGVAMLSGSGLMGLDVGLIHGVPIAPRPLWLPRAAVVARIGEDRFRRGDIDDPLTIEPRYARRSAAEEQRDERSTFG